MTCKLIGSVLAAGALSIGVFGWNAWSYVKTSVAGVTDAIQDSVPVEFEIRRARTMLTDLVAHTEANRNYQKSDLLQIIRILKNYDFFREPQMELFKSKRRKR